MLEEDVFAEEDDLVCYAGAGYSRPRRLCVGSLDFSDYDTPGGLASALSAFSSAHADATVEVRESEFADCRSYMSGFSAYRTETAEEVAERVDSYRKAVQRRARQHAQDRRAEYERMKSEFGNA